MSRTDRDPVSGTVPTDPSWKGILLLGAIAALLALAGTLTDIALTMIPGWDASSVPSTIQAWFTQFQASPLLGLRNLDLLNVTIWLIEIPLVLALYGAHRRTNQASAALALIVVLVGTAVLVTSNAALPMLGLSKRYSTTLTDTQRLTLEAAGEALLARGAHGSLGAFVGFLLSSIGTLLMGLAMLKGKVFSRAAAWVGIVGIALLLSYVIASTFVPASGTVMLIVTAMPGGILMMVWNVLVAKKLFQLRTAGN